MKELCPRTRDAAIPLLRGAAYSRTLLLFPSVTQRFPAESKRTSPGVSRPVGEIAETDEVNISCPMTVAAASPVEKGLGYSSTLLLLVSATQRFPEESKVMPEGL